MGAFGAGNTTVVLIAVLGSLCLLAFVAGLIKLWMQKRYIDKHTKLEELKRKGKGTDEEMLAPITTRNLDEGDLFGVRAIEAGYFGGVAQSRPTSPSNSYIQSLNPNMTRWSGKEKNSSVHSPSASVSSSGISINGLGLNPLKAAKTAKNKPLSLPLERLEDKDPLHYGQKLSNIGGTHQSTSSTASSIAIPSHPMDASRSRAASNIGSQASYISVEAHSLISKVPDSPPSSTQHQFLLTHGTLDSPRSIFPATNYNPESSSSRPESRENDSLLPPLTIPIPPLLYHNSFTESDSSSVHQRRWSNGHPEGAVSRFSVSKMPVSSQQVADEAPPKQRLYTHISTLSASSTYTTSTSTSYPKTSDQSRGRSISESTTSRSRSSSNKSLSRARDSIRRPKSTHARQTLRSRDRSNHRRSRDRDQLHCDPSSSRRDRSGSVQGRVVNFDRPRESPFSNSQTIKSHSRTSLSSFSSTINIESSSHKRAQSPAPALPRHHLNVATLNTDPLSANRTRSASEASQSSMSSIYDSYYQQAVVPHPNVNGMEGESEGFNIVQGRKDVPDRLNTRPTNGETIIGALGSSLRGGGEEKRVSRFPSRVEGW